MKTQWYFVGIMFKEGMQKYICQFDSNLEKSVFEKRDSDFVKLKKVRWIKADKKRKKSQLIKLEQYATTGHTDHFYIRKEFIESVWPLKNLPILNKFG